MTVRSLTRGELIAAASALLLLVLMVAVPWYGVLEIPGRPGSHTGAGATETGWQGLAVLRWLILLAILAAFAAVGIHARRPTRQLIAGLRLALFVLGSATAFGLTIRVLIDLPSPNRVVDQKLGALFGLISALGVVYGASEAIREQRARLAAAGSGAGGAAPQR